MKLLLLFVLLPAMANLCCPPEELALAEAVNTLAPFCRLGCLSAFELTLFVLDPDVEILNNPAPVAPVMLFEEELVDEAEEDFCR